MTQEQIDTEIVHVTALIRARDGKLGYSQNVEAIKARLAELKDMTPDNG